MKYTVEIYLEFRIRSILIYMLRFTYILRDVSRIIAVAIVSSFILLMYTIYMYKNNAIFLLGQ